MPERLWFLKRSQLFEQLSEQELGRLEADSRIRNFRNREVIYSPADQAESVFLVVSGRVRLVSLTAGGKEAVLALIEPGELFGELALVSGGAREEHAESAGRSTVASLSRSTLESLMDRNGRLAIGIWKFIGWQRRRIERRLKSLLFRTTRERVVFLLADLLEPYGRIHGASAELTIRLSHQEIANLIGATRESVTLSLGELQTEGLLELGRQRIVVQSVSRIRTLAGLPSLVPDSPHPTTPILAPPPSFLREAPP
jgi:CRP/FNR family cyclic AMP-dependent transcriptional regulator